VLTEPTKSLPFVHTLVHRRLLTLDQVADYLAVGRPLVDDLVRTGGLRVLRMGPELRIRPEELEAFLRRAEK
jgi:excisionase family DNA binding protein